MEKLLITQALNELKTLDARINRAISNTSFITSAKKNETKVTSNLTKEDYISSVKANVQSINDLIERRKLIKAAIVKSNADTNVIIAGVTMTVADAIERKSSINYENDMLVKMKYQYNQHVGNVNMKNVEMEDKIDKLVTTAFGKDSKTTIKADDYDSIAKPYRESNEYALVDPLNLKAKIEQLETDIEAFTSEVDSALQISNCITFIEF